MQVLLKKSIDKMMEEVVNKEKIIEKPDHTLKLQLKNHSLVIEIYYKNKDSQIFFTEISKDSFPNNLQNIFENAEEIYNFLTD